MYFGKTYCCVFNSNLNPNDKVNLLYNMSESVFGHVFVITVSKLPISFPSLAFMCTRLCECFTVIATKIYHFECARSLQNMGCGNFKLASIYCGNVSFGRLHYNIDKTRLRFNFNRYRVLNFEKSVCVIDVSHRFHC